VILDITVFISHRLFLCQALNLS